MKIEHDDLRWAPTHKIVMRKTKQKESNIETFFAFIFTLIMFVFICLVIWIL